MGESASHVLEGVRHDLSRAWRALALTDLAAKVLGAVLLGPLVTVMLRWFLVRAGSDGVVTDDAILFFVLSPLGLLTLLVVGSVAGAIYFAEIAVLVTIAVAAQAETTVGPVDALRGVASRARALIELAGRALVRLALVAAPVLAVSGLVYLLLLTRYDIYYYLTVKPTEYWIALVAIGALAAVGAFFIIRWLVSWSFAIPILMLEKRDPGPALTESVSRTRPRLRALAAWHGAWLLGSLALSGVATVVVGLFGRALIPSSGSLSVVAAGVGVVAVVSFTLNVIALVASNLFYATMLGRLYSAARPESVESLSFASEAEASPFSRTTIRAITAFAMVAVIAGVATVAWLALEGAKREHTAQVTAHRGAKHDAPENTLAAVELAIEQGADWVEIDVQLTSDERVILAHDRDFNRVSGSALRAETANYDELRILDVGAWFAPEFEGEHPPTLEEVLEVCRNRAGLNIELKYFGPDRGLAPKVIELVDAAGMADQIVMMSFAHDRIAEAKALRPDWTMGLLVAVAIGDVLRLEADFYAVSTSAATRAFVRAAHRRGREVHVWTVDDPLRMTAMVSRGVDNLITGYAVTAQSVLVERAAMHPVERLLVDIAAELGIVRVAPSPPASENDA